MESVVISLGGSVLIQDKEDTAYMRKLAKILLGLSTKYKLFVVTGGGRIARYYISASARATSHRTTTMRRSTQRRATTSLSWGA
jgi:uridylate kinase